MQGMALDAADVRILNHLQTHGRASNAELAEIAFLSASQCHRRVKRLEAEGIINGYRAEVDPAAVGLDISAFIHVSLSAHGENPAIAFVEAVESLPAVTECYSLAGDTDYLLRVAMPTLQAFSEFLMNELIPLPGIGSVKSYVVLEEIRRSRALPIAEISRSRVRE